MLDYCPECKTLQDPRQELETIAACLSAVADLLKPQEDMNVVDRGSLATLMAYLSDRNRRAQAAYFEPMQAQGRADNGR